MPRKRGDRGRAYPRRKTTRRPQFTHLHNIRAWREYLDLSQGELAKATGRTTGQISNYEKGANVPLDALHKMAWRMNITVGQLVEQMPPDREAEP
jgi:transcriptional regulator with XRE-family HTH domain